MGEIVWLPGEGVKRHIKSRIPPHVGETPLARPAAGAETDVELYTLQLIFSSSQKFTRSLTFTCKWVAGQPPILHFHADTNTIDNVNYD